jgi:hypothetical protein
MNTLTSTSKPSESRRPYADGFTLLGKRLPRQSRMAVAGTCLAVLMAATASGQWEQVPGAAINGPVACPSAGWNCSAQAIAVGPRVNGFTAAWVLGTGHTAGGDYYIYQWNNYEWVQMPGAATQIAMSPQGYPWVLNHLGDIYYWNGSNFVQVGGCATSISVGPAAAVYGGGASPAPNAYGSEYGDPWIIGCDDNIYQLQGSTWVRQPTPVYNQPSSVPIPTQIAVSPQGVPWIVNSAGNVYFWYPPSPTAYDGSYLQVGGCAISIAVGTAYAYVAGCGGSSAGYNIWRTVNPSTNYGNVAWAQVAGTASQISLSPDLGIPWIVNYFGQIYQ